MNEHQFLDLRRVTNRQKQFFSQSKSNQEQFYTPRLNQKQSSGSKLTHTKNKQKNTFEIKANDESFSSFQDQTVLLQESCNKVDLNNNQLNSDQENQIKQQNLVQHQFERRLNFQQHLLSQKIKHQNKERQQNLSDYENQVNLLDSPQNWKQSSNDRNNNNKQVWIHQNNDVEYQNYITQLDVSALVQKNSPFFDEQSSQCIHFQKDSHQKINNRKQISQNQSVSNSKQEKKYKKQRFFEQEKQILGLELKQDQQSQLKQYNENEDMDFIQQEFKSKLNKIRLLKMEIMQQKNIIQQVQQKDFKNNSFILIQTELLATAKDDYKDDYQKYEKSQLIQIQKQKFFIRQSEDDQVSLKAKVQNNQQSETQYKQQSKASYNQSRKANQQQQTLKKQHQQFVTFHLEEQKKQNKEIQISEIEISKVQNKHSVSLQNQSRSQIALYNQNNFHIESSNSGCYLFQSSNSKKCQFNTQLLMLQRKQQDEQNKKIKMVNISDQKHGEDNILNNEFQNKIKKQNKKKMQSCQLIRQEIQSQKNKKIIRQKSLEISKQLSLLKKWQQTFSYEIQQQIFNFEQFFSQLKQQMSFSLFALINNATQNIRRLVQQQYQQQIQIIKQNYEYQTQLLAKQYQQKLKNHFDSSDGPSIVPKNIINSNQQEQYEQVLADLSLQNQSLCQQLNLQHQHNQILFNQNQRFKKNFKQFQILQQKYQQLSLNNQRLTQYIFQSQEKICCLKNELQKMQNDKKKFYQQSQKQIKKNMQQETLRQKKQFFQEKQVFLIQLKKFQQINRQLQSKVKFLQEKLKQMEMLNKSQSSISSQSESQKSIQKLELKNYQFQLKQYEIRLSQSQNNLQQSRLQYFNLKQQFLKKQHELNTKTLNLKQQTQQLQRLKQYVFSLQKRQLTVSKKVQELNKQLSEKQTIYEDLRIKFQKSISQYEVLSLSASIKQKQISTNHETNCMNYTNLGISQVETYNNKNNFFKKSDVFVSSGASLIQKRQIQKKEQFSSLKDLLCQQKYQKQFGLSNLGKQIKQNDFNSFNSKNSVGYQSETILIQNTERNSFNDNWNNLNKRPLDTQQSVNRILESIKLKKSRVSNSYSLWNNQSSQINSYEKQSIIKPKSPSSNNKQIQQLKDTKMKHISQKLEKLRSDIRSQIKELKK